MANNEEEFDLIVIGGGPGGSTVATLVAMQGYRVLLLEKDKFPRYQIGESLLPHTLGICKLLGVLDEVENAGFMPKNGGVWYWGTEDKPGWGFNFDEILASSPVFGKAYAYQVERMKFDEILLRNAQRKGVDVREEHRVEKLIEENGRVVGARFIDSSGKTKVARARFVADAGGNSSPFSKLAGERLFADRFRNLALFGYYHGGKRLPAPQSGSILNVSFNKGWFWLIPLTKTLTSVGAVIGAEHADSLKVGHEEAMKQFIDSCPMIKDYLSDAVRVTEGVYGQFRVRKDWSYCNTNFWSPGLVLIGDTACFVDPLFSSGVHLSTYSGLLGARSINTCLQSELNARDEKKCFKEYELRYREEYMHFFNFLTQFYVLNRSKEEYFRHANKILGSKENDRHAFIRLVSGFSNKVPTASSKSKDLSIVNEHSGPSDIRNLVNNTTQFDLMRPKGSKLAPSEDGFHWVEIVVKPQKRSKKKTHKRKKAARKAS